MFRRKTPKTHGNEGVNFRISLGERRGEEEEEEKEEGERGGGKRRGVKLRGAGGENRGKTPAQKLQEMKGLISQFHLHREGGRRRRKREE